jgi:hypothetical protein
VSRLYERILAFGCERFTAGDLVPPADRVKMRQRIRDQLRAEGKEKFEGPPERLEQHIDRLMSMTGATTQTGECLSKPAASPP